MERESLGKYLRRLVTHSGMTGRLIAINTVFFLFFLLINIIEKLAIKPGLTDSIKFYFAGPGNLSELLTKPWTVLTQMFTHANFGHFLFNCIALYFSGKLLSLFLGERRVVTTYIFGGIFAYFFHLFAYTVFPLLAAQIAPGVVGASGAIMALFIAAAIHKPSFKVMFFGVFPVQLFILAALYLIVNLVGIGSESKTAYMAHIGGAIFGWVSVVGIYSRYNLMRVIEDFLDRFRFGKNKNKQRKSKSHLKVYSSTPAATLTDEEYNSSKAARQARVDAILDKIGTKGYESLTQQEKDILFHESKR